MSFKILNNWIRRTSSIEHENKCNGDCSECVIEQVIKYITNY